jgi:endoglucanase
MSPNFRISGLAMAGFCISIITVLAQRAPSPKAAQITNETNTVTQIYTVREDVLAIEIKTGEIIQARQQSYKAQIGDRIAPQPNNSDLVKTPLGVRGNLVGKKILYDYDRRTGLVLGQNWLKQTSTYSIQSPDDDQYTQPQPPQSLSHKTKPTAMAITDNVSHDWQQQHIVYLTLPQPLKAGKTYNISFQGDQFKTDSFTYLPETNRSESIHVSQLGFRPDDPSKVAFLSTWMGSGGGLDYGEPRDFWIKEEKTNHRVFQGKTRKRRSNGEPEDPKGRSYNGTNVYAMDFSDFQQPGNFRVCVAAIGCSFPFEIARDRWQVAFYTAARGFYHQRSGIELKAPYTTFKRPLGFHPQQGVKVYASTTKLMDVDQGFWQKPSAFDSLNKTKTKTIVPNAWGGYFDAGDWDRRIQHLDAAQNMMELAELFPEFVAKTQLNLPESGNKRPDLIDEALWGLDFYRRLQTDNGGIRGGIQSITDPKRGETSWQDSGEVYAYAPEAWASYIYAASAAQMAHWLRASEPDLAKTYQTSALRAIKYAEQEQANITDSDLLREIRNRRNHAALELYRLTGDAQWHRLFLETTAFQELGAENRRHQLTAAFLYSRLPATQVDSKVQQQTRQAMIAEANLAVAQTQQSGFGWAKAEPEAPIGWGHGLGAPKAIPLLRAHFLTQETQYLSAALLASQFSAGANPDNMVFTTGLGIRSPKHPLIFDQRITQQAPPPGITVYGPFDQQFYGNFWTIQEFKDSLFPKITDWPGVESYFDVFLMPIATEFTIMETMGPTTYTWGYLAARASTPGNTP